MLLGRVLIALVLEQRQRANKFRTCLGRFNYFINESALSGDERGSSPTVREGVVIVIAMS
jgi:hypothetical protein